MRPAAPARRSAPVPRADAGTAAAHHDPDGGFRNPWGDPRPPGGLVRWALVHRTTRPRPVDPPPSAFARATPSPAVPRGGAGELRATWVGHATWLLQLGGANVLTDPVWAERASPVRWLGPRRRVGPGLPLDALPPLDVVAVSHNHYDHLDAAAVRRLAAAAPGAEWLVPLGVGPLVRRLGAARVRELDWWEECEVAGLRAAAVPARHLSGRGLRDRARTLWCGWTFAAGPRRAYFAGDTAHHPEFAAIGARHGPFDLALLPIGGYEPRWYMRHLHLDPEEAVRAYGELCAAAPAAAAGARCLLAPMHWGTFKLTDEALDEPPRRARAAWAAAGFAPDDLWVPVHGETKVIAR